jgi:hypothetical protein
MQTCLGKHIFFTAMNKTYLPAILLLILTACNQNNQSKTESNSPAQPATNAATTTTSAGADLPDPCKLLTKGEAEAVLGEAVRDPEPRSLGGVRICEYYTAAVHGGITPLWVHIAVAPEQRSSWDAGKKLHVDSKEARPVAGIGDDAYFLLDDLDVLSKQRSITIGVMKNVDKPDHAKAVADAEIAVAQKIIPRM